MIELSCPVSGKRVDENVVRIIAFIVAIISICCILLGNYWAIVFLMFDFAARAFTSGKFSLLKFIAARVAKILSFTPKLTDLAAKKFAAAMGFVFCLLIITAFFLNLFTLALIFTSLMAIFALLESFLAICIGCYVYTFVHLIKNDSNS